MALDTEALKALLLEGGSSVFSIIKKRAGEHLDLARVRKDFVEERSKRLLELGVEFARATSDEERARIKESMATVTDAITSELWAAATDQSASSRNTIKAAVEGVRDFLVSALPVVAKILLGAI